MNTILLVTKTTNTGLVQRLYVNVTEEKAREDFGATAEADSVHSFPFVGALEILNEGKPINLRIV